MPVITGTVGRGGNNRVHDVAVIQAALRNAKLPGAGGPFWSGRIDGRKSPALDEAIGAFQQAARVPVTGRIGQSGTDANRLESAQPQSHKAMRAVAGTAAVWRTSARAKRFAEVAKAAEASPFPEAERGALAAIAKRCAQSFGLGVELQDAAVTADGRFRARMGVPDIEWLDASGTRFQKGAAPADVTRATARAGQGNPTWRTETQPRDGALLELTSMRAIPALAGPPTLTTEALETFGLTTRPKDQISQACIAGCARLAAAGDKSAAAEEGFDALLGALAGVAPDIAEKIRDVGIRGFSGAQPSGTIPFLTGTIFFGGAEMTGEYVDDFVRLLGEAGVQGASAANQDDWSRGTMAGDALFAAKHRSRDQFFTDFSILPSYPSSQFNLMGYSYGATLVANIALDYADAGGRVSVVK
jgi:peptidoglycan hydrolase-like protein with peptidoglycan-binding domain